VWGFCQENFIAVLKRVEWLWQLNNPKGRFKKERALLVKGAFSPANKRINLLFGRYYGCPYWPFAFICR
jgi:hypothetical protein